MGWFSIRQNDELTLANFSFDWANYHCWKWPNIIAIWSHWVQQKNLHHRGINLGSSLPMLRVKCHTTRLSKDPGSYELRVRTSEPWRVSKFSSLNCYRFGNASFEVHRMLPLLLTLPLLLPRNYGLRTISLRVGKFGLTMDSQNSLLICFGYNKTFSAQRSLCLSVNT